MSSADNERSMSTPPVVDQAAKVAVWIRVLVVAICEWDGERSALEEVDGCLTMGMSGWRGVTGGHEDTARALQQAKSAVGNGKVFQTLPFERIPLSKVVNQTVNAAVRTVNLTCLYCESAFPCAKKL